MRLEPHNATCPDCGAHLIEAEEYGGHSRTLDATPHADGEFRAHYAPNGWVCVRINDSPVFAGMRRREHACAGGIQLELSTEAAPERPNLTPNKEPAQCQSPSGPRSTAQRSSSSDSS